MDLTPITRAERRQALLELWILHALGGVLIGTTYLVHVPAGLSVRAWVFVVLGLVSTVGTLALVPGFALWLAERLVTSTRTLGRVAAPINAVFLILLYVDTRLYNLLRYHFNGAVWNVVLTRGSEDAIHLGNHVWVPVFLVLAAIVGLELLLWRALLSRRLRRSQARGPRRLGVRRVVRPSLVCAAVLVGVVGVEKTIFAAADLSGDHQVESAAGVLPLYPRLRVSQLLPQSPDEERAPDMGFEGATLAYPLGYPDVDPAGPRPNVLLLVLDSWRHDQLAPETTPRLCEFAQGGRVFEDHLAGGNGTRYGVFSLLYGLYGSYWFPTLAAQRPPVLVDVVRELGYDVQVFSSASMNFPEFRQTAWVDVLERVHDEFPSKLASERDRLMVEAFEAWAGARGAGDAPFFTFVLLDSPHQPYDAPGGPFQPAAEELDYVELVHSDSPELVERVFNRYRNSVLYADGMAGRVLDALEAAGELEDTLVVVTGDHGEEFQECGFWGHTSNFSPQQIRVPFVLKGPGVEPGVELRPTSHHDVPSTILELLGADPEQRPLYSLGQSLFDPDPDRRRVVAGWSDIGLWTPSGILDIPLDSKRAHEIEVRDRGWQLVQDPGAAREAEAPALQRLAEECRRFLSTAP